MEQQGESGKIKIKIIRVPHKQTDFLYIKRCKILVILMMMMTMTMTMVMMMMTMAMTMMMMMTMVMMMTMTMTTTMTIMTMMISKITISYKYLLAKFCQLFSNFFKLCHKNNWNFV